MEKQKKVTERDIIKEIEKTAETIAFCNMSDDSWNMCRCRLRILFGGLYEFRDTEKKKREERKRLKETGKNKYWEV